MLQKLSEGKAVFYAPVEKIVSKKMGVFYNPKMKLNRDMTVIVLKSHDFGKSVRIAEPLAGTGVRSIRLLLEVQKSMIEQADINDGSDEACKLINKNLRLNRMAARASVSCGEASMFLLKSTGYDYIDIDPFGYPGRFLHAAMQRLARGGILGVTATDLSALAGTAPKACYRKYWAKPLRSELMHEIGLRIMVRFVQLIGMQYEKALQPVLCYYRGHYMRAFFHCEKGLGRADKIGTWHGYAVQCKKCLKIETAQIPAMRCSSCGSTAEYAGPMWLGKLNEKKLLKAMMKNAKAEKKDGKIYAEAAELLAVLSKEAEINALGFYDTNRLSQVLRIKPPKKLELIQAMQKAGYRAAPTHFSPIGIRTNMPLEQVKKCAKSLSKPKSL